MIIFDEKVCEFNVLIGVCWLLYMNNYDNCFFGGLLWLLKLLE